VPADRFPLIGGTFLRERLALGKQSTAWVKQGSESATALINNKLPNY
jgi:hypothetical protein|tara:strand:+ start:645 stop:785 length:141 start_codon:yes stop_codon:yes gene_type:complete